MKDSTGTSLLFSLIILVIAIAVSVWVYRSEYRDCMAKKHDEIVCKTYANSFFR